jgi:hypothetical protein
MKLVVAWDAGSNLQHRLFIFDVCTWYLGFETFYKHCLISDKSMG